MRSALILFACLSCIHCGDDSDSGFPSTADGGRTDSGSGGGGGGGGGSIALPPNGSPFEANLGATASNCVDYCRQLVGDCTTVQVRIDGVSLGSGLGAAECAQACASADDFAMDIARLGCLEQRRAYESCLLTDADTSADCALDGCSLEWGVFAGCAGL